MNGKPTQYKGVIYASILEAQVAKILTEHNIKFDYSRRFFTNKDSGHYREVDFFIKGQHLDIVWCDFSVNAIEVKGRLDIRAYQQRKELADVGIVTFLATKPIIDFWRKQFFLKADMKRYLAKRAQRRKK